MTIITNSSFAHRVAQKMAGSEPVNELKKSYGSFAVNLGGYTLTTITPRRGGIVVWHDLHPNSWDKQNRTQHIQTAKRRFKQAYELALQELFIIQDMTEETQTVTSNETPDKENLSLPGIPNLCAPHPPARERPSH
jgi:hypothetical protein